jgi:hypothetical protein
MRIYFEYPENATQARAALVSYGIPERDVALRIHEHGGGVREGLKRFAADPSSKNSHGASLIIDQVDWLTKAKIDEVARTHDGEICPDEEIA